MSLKIRAYKPEDYIDIERLVCAYAHEQGWYLTLGRMQDYIENVTSGPLIVAEVDQVVVGAFAYRIVPHQLHGIPQAQKVAWYVYPEYRGKVGLKLLQEFEKECAGLEALVLLPSDLPPPKGYKAIEVLYSKELD